MRAHYDSRYIFFLRHPEDLPEWNTLINLGLDVKSLLLQLIFQAGDLIERQFLPFLLNSKGIYRC